MQRRASGWSRPTRVLLLALVGTGVIAACGADPAASGGDDGPDASQASSGSPGSSSGGTSSGGPGTSSGSSGALDASIDATVPDGPDLPPTGFPAATPELFGYALQDAFPGMFLSGAMDIEWPAGSTEPFVLQRGGHIVQLHAGTDRTLVLNFEDRVAVRGEAGTLGMALHPKFADAASPHPYVYVWWTVEGSPTHQRLSRFTWDAQSGQFPLGSELIMINQAEGFTEHNGAHLRFGHDGFLYFGNGDDTRTDETTQKLDAGLFSGIFRLDVDQLGGAISHAPPRQPLNATTQGYFIPNDNPFVGMPNANEEYFALGFRNPFSFNVDRQTGELWLGDVGDSFREEVDHVVKGGNYQWPFVEGDKTMRAGAPTIGTSTPPVYAYAHRTLGDLTAITGGFVYRGSAMPEIQGKFLFSDWPTGRVWALDPATGVRTSLVETNDTSAPVSFGQDAAGEIYLVSWDKILKLVRDPAPVAVPKKLSDTHLFRNLSTMKTSSSLVPYSLRSPLFSDSASKSRWVYMPPNATASVDGAGKVTLPPGALLIKQFDLPDTAQPSGGRTRHLETRVLVVGATETYGLSYRWNHDGTDADLMTEAIDESISDAAPDQSLTWHFPSFGECWSCHRAENRVLGFRGEQLGFDLAGENQLATLAARGVFDTGSIGAAPAPIAVPSDETATPEARAFAYLASNCAPCHHAGASYLGGEETWIATAGVAAADRHLINAPNHNYPMASLLGMPNAPLVAPGDPDHSLIVARLHSTDPDLRMPPLGRTHVDPVGEAALRAWIQSLTP